ncbi:MAG: glycosyltransferase family A protein [Candidatus Korarchaeota archaeon]|nr:glycosyltransferase family A protein [Candidatus Korarchaeota archaeon]
MVIPTKNSSRTLDVCLKSVLNQTYPNLEIIVVDNFSEDGTIKIAEKYGAIVIKASSERSAAKNIGLRRARGEYIIFIDSDMELSPTLIEECVEVAQSSPNFGGAIIPERSVGSSWWVTVRNFERSFYSGTQIESARFFRRDLALMVGGFDEDLVFFEEATLPSKLRMAGYNVDYRVGSFIYHHEEDFSLIRWLKKKYYYGKTLALYLDRYGEYTADDQLNPLRRVSIFLRNRRFYSHPGLAMGVLILKLMEFISVLAGHINGEVIPSLLSDLSRKVRKLANRVSRERVNPSRNHS